MASWRKWVMSLSVVLVILASAIVPLYMPPSASADSPVVTLPDSNLEAAITEAIGAPTLVSPAKGASVIGTSVTFQWNAVPGAVNYRLVVSTISVVSLQARKLDKKVGNVTGYVDTGYPMNGKKYYWWVWAYDAAGNPSTKSQVRANQWYFYSISPCGTPTLVSPAKGASVIGTSVTFHWNAVPGAVNYRLVVRTNSDVWPERKKLDKLNKKVGNVTSYVDTGYRMEGKKHYWSVWAYDAAGNPSTLSQVRANQWYFYDISPCGTPTLVSPEKRDEVAGSSVTFEWDAVPGAVNYRLVVSTISVVSYTGRKLDKKVGNVTSYVDTGYPMNGRKYYWWVWAYDADGNPSTKSQVAENRRYFTSTE